MDAILNLVELADKVYSQCQTVQANKEQCSRLAEHVSSLREVLHGLQGQDPSNMPQDLDKGLSELETCFRDAEELVSKYGSTSFFGRVFKARTIEEEFEGVFQRLGDIRHLLSLSLQVEQRGKVKSVQDTVDRSEQKIDSLHEKMEKLDQQLQSYKEVKGSEIPPPGNSSQDADKLLAQIRSRFVEKASLPLIKQLLDDLQEERVLNSEEAESVLEEQSARTDRARCLIDMVRKKGRKASGKMITCLRQKDPSLTETLGMA